MRGLDDPRQREISPYVVLAFHDQDGPRLHRQIERERESQSLRAIRRENYELEAIYG